MVCGGDGTNIVVKKPPKYSAGPLPSSKIATEVGPRLALTLASVAQFTPSYRFTYSKLDVKMAGPPASAPRTIEKIHSSLKPPPRLAVCVPSQRYRPPRPPM